MNSGDRRDRSRKGLVCLREHWRIDGRHHARAGECQEVPATDLDADLPFCRVLRVPSRLLMSPSVTVVPFFRLGVVDATE